MKFKNILCSLICGIFITGISFADELSEISNHLSSFSDQFFYVIPNAATQTNVYADAWIGKFVPSLPMHFALGIDGGITKFDISELKAAGETAHISNIPSSLLFPSVNVNAKIGGFILPFDVGLSAFVIDTSKLNFLTKKIDLNFISVGANVRWAILQGLGPLPKWSVGAGYYYSKGSIGKSNSEACVKTSYKTQTFVAETQISKTFIFVTPFIGFRAIFSDSDISYNWKYDPGFSGITSGEFSSHKDISDSFIPQLFGGIGFKMGFAELDFNASFDIPHTLWTAGTSLRFQM